MRTPLTPLALHDAAKTAEEALASRGLSGKPEPGKSAAERRRERFARYDKAAEAYSAGATDDLEVAAQLRAALLALNRWRPAEPEGWFADLLQSGTPPEDEPPKAREREGPFGGFLNAKCSSAPVLSKVLEHKWRATALEELRSVQPPPSRPLRWMADRLAQGDTDSAAGSTD